MNERTVDHIGWKEAKKLAKKTFTLPNLVQRHKAKASYGMLALIMLASCVETTQKGAEVSGLHRVDEAITTAVAYDPNVNLQDLRRNPLTTTRYIEMAEALLKTPGLNMEESSFVDALVRSGGRMGRLEIFGPAPRFYIAGREGLLKRRTPSLDSSGVGPYPPVGYINWGEEVAVIAELTIEYPDGITSRWGLGAQPWRVTRVPLQGTDLLTPNTSVEGIEAVKREPFWVYLSQPKTLQPFADPVLPK